MLTKDYVPEAVLETHKHLAGSSGCALVYSKGKFGGEIPCFLEISSVAGIISCARRQIENWTSESERDLLKHLNCNVLSLFYFIFLKALCISCVKWQVYTAQYWHDLIPKKEPTPICSSCCSNACCHRQTHKQRVRKCSCAAVKIALAP